MLFLLLVLVACSLGVQRTFHGNQVLRVVPTSVEQVSFLHQRFLKGDRRYDFWSEPTALHKSVDIHVEAELIDEIKSELLEQGLKVETFISNVQELVDQEQSPELEGMADPWLASYHTYDEVITWVNNIQRKFPHLVELVDHGKSYQGRQLLGLMISSNKSATPVGAWFDGGLHSREWITIATVLWMTNQLLEDYGHDGVVTSLLDNMNIYVLPIFNPDGYVYTWATDRMWRKTRRPNPGSPCVGTDPNRNWDFHWGEAGTSTDPCSDAFEGAKPFSEIEVKQVADFICAHPNIHGYINFHSYSQLWMSPWGWTDKLPPDFNVQNNLSANCVGALRAVHGTVYQYGPIATTIYPASGSSADYTYGKCNSLFSYGVELRDTGRYGFLLPPNQIVPSGEETYAAVKVWLQRTIQTGPK